MAEVNRDWTSSIDAAVDALYEQMVKVRRHLHAHPEPSGEEIQTTRFIRERLSEAGISVRPAVGEIGLIAEMEAGAPHVQTGLRSDPAPGIGLRADIDALRIQDAKECEYRSHVPGVMHACGHDAHATIVMGALMALHQVARQGALPWAIRCRGLFQPAEETNRGSLAMIAAGAAHGLDTLFSVHMDPSRAAGTIGVRYGILTADCDEVHIQITGRGGHASRPHDSIDPIAAAAQLINALYLFVPRNIDSQDPLVLTIGQITGGENYNVIPDQVILRGTMRSLGGSIRQKAITHIEHLVKSIAGMSRTKIEVEFRPGPPSVVNDRELTELIRLTATELLGPDNVKMIERPSMGGEDFANYLVHVPGTMFRLGCATSAKALLHSPAFDIDERSLAVGAKILARAVVKASAPDRARTERTI